MGLFKFFGLDEQQEEKGNVFCEGCFYYMEDYNYDWAPMCKYPKEIIIPKDYYKEEHVKRTPINKKCSVVNRNNNCPNFTSMCKRKGGKK